MKFRRFYYENTWTGLTDSFIVPIIPYSIIRARDNQPDTWERGLNGVLGMDTYHFAHYISTKSIVWKLRGEQKVILKSKDKDKIVLISSGTGELSPYLGTAGERTNGLMQIDTKIDYHLTSDKPEIDGSYHKDVFYWDQTTSGGGGYMGKTEPTKDSLPGSFAFLAIDENFKFYNMDISADKFGFIVSENFSLQDLQISENRMRSEFNELIKNVESTVEEYKEDLDMSGAIWDDIEKRFAPVANTKGVAMYKMTKGEVQNLFTSLYTKTISENIREFLGTGNVDGAIKSLTFYYHWGKLLKTGDEAPVRIYSQTLDSTSGKTVVGRKVASEYIGLKMGNFSVKPIYSNFLDYAPYTSFLLNVPMYGSIELNASDIMNRVVTLRYVVDVSKNIGMIFINIIEGGKEYTYKKLQFTPGVDIPVNTMTSGQNKLIASLTSLAGGVVGGPVGAMVGNTIGSTLTGGPQAQSFSGGSSSHGHLDIFTPQLIRIYPSIGADNTGALGKPVALTGKIGNFKGYVKTGNITAMGNTKYKDKIENLLKNGVYI